MFFWGIRRELPLRKSILVKADKDRISQAISNLISNAIKFTNEGNIDVVIDKNNSNEVLVSVRDTGSGLDPDILPRLFSSNILTIIFLKN
jgi:signal transduction histidine kinase